MSRPPAVRECWGLAFTRDQDDLLTEDNPGLLGVYWPDPAYKVPEPQSGVTLAFYRTRKQARRAARRWAYVKPVRLRVTVEVIE